MWVTAQAGHIWIALWVSGSTGVTHLQSWPSPYLMISDTCMYGDEAQ